MVASVVCGYHNYLERHFGLYLLERSLNVTLSQIMCDPFAVAVLKDNTIVGHVPCKFSAICSVFIKRGGQVTCKVTDLPQGGLGIPCHYTFHGTKVEVQNLKRYFAIRFSFGIHQQIKAPATKHLINKT